MGRPTFVEKESVALLHTPLISRSLVIQSVGIIIVSLLVACVTHHTRWTYELVLEENEFYDVQLRFYLGPSYLMYDDEPTNWDDTSFVLGVRVLPGQAVGNSNSDSIAVEKMRIGFHADTVNTLIQRSTVIPSWDRGLYITRSDYHWKFVVPIPRPDTLYMLMDLVRYDLVMDKPIDTIAYSTRAILRKDDVSLWKSLHLHD